ncbi:MAG: nuclear transport factor 2 family protein [Pseudorhodoplanes sp.]
MSDRKHVTVALLEEISAAFNAHDPERIAAFFAEDGVFLASRGPDIWGQPFVGRAAIKETFRQRFAAIPDLHYSDGEHWVSGNKATSQWRVTGTLANGEKLDCRGCDLWEFRDGKVTRKDTYYKQVVP